MVKGDKQHCYLKLYGHLQLRSQGVSALRANLDYYAWKLTYAAHTHQQPSLQYHPIHVRASQGPQAAVGTTICSRMTRKHVLLLCNAYRNELIHGQLNHLHKTVKHTNMVACGGARNLQLTTRGIVLHAHCSCQKQCSFFHCAYVRIVRDTCISRVTRHTCLS